MSIISSFLQRIRVQRKPSGQDPSFAQRLSRKSSDPDLNLASKDLRPPRPPPYPEIGPGMSDDEARLQEVRRRALEMRWRQQLQKWAERQRESSASRRAAKAKRRSQSSSPLPRTRRPWVLRVVAVSLVVLVAGFVAALIIGGGDGPARVVTDSPQPASAAKGTATTAKGTVTTVQATTTTAPPTDAQSPVGGETTTTPSQAAASVPDSGQTPTAEATSETEDEGSVDYGGIGPDTGGGPIVK